MIVAHEKEAEVNGINSPAVKNAAMRVLVGPPQGWSDYVMRVVELDADGYSPKHAHPWPHINYVVEGRGELEIQGKLHTVEQGAYAFIPDGCEHQFRNVGEGKFRFICIVPQKGHQ